MGLNDKRPPRDITAEGFFTEWLPQAFAREFGPGRRESRDITVAIHLEGQGGGGWILDVRGGVLSLRRPGAPGPEPQVSLTQPIADWRAMAVGEEGVFDLAPPNASPLDVLFVDPTSRQVLAVRGTVRFEVTGYNDRVWWMQVKFGIQPEPPTPDAVISVDAMTYAEILAKRLMPPEAYFSGKISMRGNTALAMQLAMALLPRFTT
jgi:hypothetical protein